MSSILGISHICCNTIDIETDIQLLQPLGFDVYFEENHLPIAPAKEPYMRTTTNAHDMTFLKSNTGVSVELIKHHTKHNLNTSSPYEIGLPQKNIIPTSNLPTNDLEQIFSEALDVSTHAIKSNVSYFAYRSRTNSINPMVISTSCKDIQKSRDFWQSALGFRTISMSLSPSPTWCLLQFTALIPTWTCQLLLIQTNAPITPPSYIDDVGWTCLVLLVQNITHARSEIQKTGALDVGKPFELTVGGKTYLECFFRSCDGQLLVLTQLQS